MALFTLHIPSLHHHTCSKYVTNPYTQGGGLFQPRALQLYPVYRCHYIANFDFVKHLKGIEMTPT